MSRQMNKGSIHVVVVISLVVVLTVALGAVFYQNFIMKEVVDKTSTGSNTKTEPTKTTEKSEKVITKEYCATYEKLCFDMPANWKVIDLGMPAEGNISYKVDRLEIRTDTDKKVLVLNSGISGIGGTCPDEDQTPLYVVATYTTKLRGYASEWSDDTAYAVKAISMGADGKYIAAMYLTTAKSLTQVGETKDCGFGFTTLISGMKLQTDYAGHGSVSFALIGIGNRATATKYDTKSAAIESLNTTEMNDAYNILRSVNYK